LNHGTLTDVPELRVTAAASTVDFHALHAAHESRKSLDFVAGAEAVKSRDTSNDSIFFDLV
jgi:hypothetical protein